MNQPSRKDFFDFFKAKDNAEQNKGAEVYRGNRKLSDTFSWNLV